MVDAVLEIDREIYGKFVRYRRNRKRHMYVRLRKVMCGTLKAALLYYRKNFKRAEIIWVRHKPIQPLHIKKGDKRRATYHGVACRQYESVTQK